MSDLVEHGRDLLLTAIGEICEAIALVNLSGNTLLLLQHKQRPEEVGQTFCYSEYIKEHSADFDDDPDLAINSLNVGELFDEYHSGKSSVDLSFRKTTLKLSFKEAENGALEAFLIMLKSDETNILHQITNIYVFNNCDYFIYLDSQKDSYIMFSSSNNGTPLPPAYSKSYSEEIVKYARDFVSPEDQDMVIREMTLSRVLEVLDTKGVHYIYAGVIDPDRGYTRKRLEYRYCDRCRRMVLLARTDITDIYYEEKKHHRDLQLALKQAYSDPLTGVLNQQGMRIRAQQCLKDADTLSALLFVDLDNFKEVNDTYGHTAGDTLLKAVANCLLREVKQNDFVGRYGGDEFVVFFSEVRSAEFIRERAKEICRYISEMVYKEGAEVKVTCSIGAAFYPLEAASYEELISLADKRLYIAKNLGKSRAVIEGGTE